MKPNLLYIVLHTLLLFCMAACIYGQNTDTLPIPHSQQRDVGNTFSIEPFAAVPYYFLHSSPAIYKERKRYSNYWNYSAGLLLSNYIRNVKISTGFYLSSMNYYRGGNSALLDKVSYWNIPITLSWITKGKVNPFLGVIISRPYYFNNQKSEALLCEICDTSGLYNCMVDGHPGNPTSVFRLPNITYSGNTGALQLGLTYTVKNYEKNAIIFFVYCKYKIKPEIIIEYSEVPITKSYWSVGFGLSYEAKFIDYKHKN
jgi:hypothetical protein